MKVIKAGEKTRIEFQNEDIVAFSFNAFATKATAPTVPVVDFAKCFVSAVLSQRGKEVTLFSLDLKTLIMESVWGSNAWSYILPGAAGVNISIGGTNYLLPAVVQLGGILNLRGNDKLVLTIGVNNDAFDATTTNPYISVDSIQGIGLQFEIPTINAISIMTAESQVKQSLGDNVTSIMLVSNSISDLIVKNCRIYSDRYNSNEDVNVLKLKRIHALGSIENAEVIKRYSNFKFIEEEVDQCRIEMELDPTLVAVGANYLVYRQYITDAEMINLAVSRKKDHDRYAVKKVNG